MEQSPVQTVPACPVQIRAHHHIQGRCNSQKYTYPRNYTPGIFSRTKISQKHTGGMFSRQANFNACISYVFVDDLTVLDSQVFSVQQDRKIYDRCHTYDSLGLCSPNVFINPDSNCCGFNSHTL